MAAPFSRTRAHRPSVGLVSTWEGAIPHGVTQVDVTQHDGQRVVLGANQAASSVPGDQGLQRQQTHMHTFVPGRKVTVCIRPFMTAKLPVSEGAGGEGLGGFTSCATKSSTEAPAMNGPNTSRHCR